MITVAEKTVRGRTVRYVLMHDEKGYYFAGMQCASYRRRTRAAIERSASRSNFDLYEIETK